MNNIYKVIWSKAKNCYVVASEIARSHTKSASGSEKIGGVTRRSLLASLMALSLLCGGLGAASAADSVPVDASSTPGAVEVYTKTGVNTLLDGKANTSLDNLSDAGKAVIKTTMTDELAKKADATALDGKANTSLDNLSEAGKSVIKTTMAGELANKADATAVTTLEGRVGGVEGKVTALETTVGDDSNGLVREVNELKNQGNTLNNTLGNKADKSDLDAAKAKITANEGNITALQNKTAKLSPDGTALNGMTTVETGALKVTGGISNGTGVITTLTDIDNSMKQTATNTTAINDLKTKTTTQQNAIDGLDAKTTNITHDANGTSVDGVTFNAGAVTGVTSINGTKIGMQESGKYISQDGSIWGNMKKVDTQVETNEKNIETNKTAITNLDAGLQKEVADREAADAEINKKIGSIDNNQTEYVKEEQTISQNLTKLDNKLKDTNDRTGGITRNDAESKTIIERNVTVDSNGNVTAEGKLKAGSVDAGAITTTGAVNAGSLRVENASQLKGDVTMDKTLSVTGDTTLKGTKVDGKLTVTDEADLKNTTVGGTLGVTGEATFKDKVTMEKDLEVKGELKTDKISMKNTDTDPDGTIHRSATTITADGITHNGEVEKSGVITKSQFTHTEEGSETYAKKGNTANWTETRSDVKADGVTTKVEDSKKNRTNTSQTADGIKGYATDKDGNKTYTKVTATENSFQVQDKDGKNKNHQVNTKDSSVTEITNGDGKTTKTEQTAENITNTAKDGTIKNDAKDIVNNASGNISNKSQTMDTTVTGKATESYGSLDTTVNGNETHIVKGTKMETVDGKVTENYKAGQETNVTGNQDIKVSGTQTTTATDINRNASSSMVDKVDNAYGTNTETKEAGKTTTDVSIKGTGEKGQYIRGANESRDYLIKGTLMNSETKTAEATSTEITDATNKASTRQDAKNLAGSVTNGTETGVSGIHANDDGSVSIDSAVAGGGMSSVINQKKDSIQSAVGDGTNSTVIRQDKDNVTIASSNGTVAIVGKDIVNNASESITNKAKTMDTTVTGKATESYGELDTTVTGQATENFNGGLNTKVTGAENHTVTGKQTNTVEGGQENIISGGQINKITGDQTTTVTGKVTENYKAGQATNVTGNQDIHVTGKQTNKIDGDQENTIGGNQTTTVTGDISNKAENITNEASNSITDKVGDHTRVLDSDGITDTVGGSTFKQRIDKIMMESKNVSIKAEETLTNEAKVITNKASEVINNEAVNINNTATGIITSKASEIKNQADKLISNKVGENTWENMENGKITTSIKDGAKQNLTQSDAAGTTQSTVDGGKSTVTIQNADGLADAVTDGTNTSVQNQTASAIAAAVKDGAGNENASVANATTSVNTIKSGSKANTVISTADGTSFINSEAAAPVGDGTEVKTTIKGNTITTGKVTMDYAEVMKDIGVRGNANIAGKTTTGSLEVKGESKLTGDVTMESNATVKKDLTVEGNTNLKNTKVDGTLDVTQKATFGDSVSIAKDLSVDGNATIKGDVTAKSYKVGDKTYISAAGINANDQKITNVADGSISEGSKDAVNGGQLYTVKNDLEGKVNKVGANAAAMANLHPMEFDPSSKWNIAAAIGNYGSETAAALGAFYRPNDDVMVNLSTAFGTGENMVGGGVSVRLGKGGNKLSREETNALKAQVADLTARMDALLSVLNPNMSKDFPDVPENHWAYEAVSRLAGNDIVQGYPDGEFHGERTMTRYEMAEIIYNALSRGAEAERKLVEEFKPELQAMAASEKATAEKAEG